MNPTDTHTNDGGWRPISEAPEYVDGIELDRCLVYSTEFGISIGKVCRFHDGALITRIEGQCGQWNITHFRALPAPPKEEAP